jgi:hypothetical protein
MPFGIAAQKVTTSSHPGFDFGTHRRYTWSANHIVTRQGQQSDAIIEQKIVQSVDRTLAAKGFSENRSAPDFLVSCDAGATSNADVGAASPPLGAIPYSWGDRLDVWYSVDGTVTFRLSDAKSNQVVWTAVATKKIRDPRKVMNNLDQQVEQVVSKAFKSFPPRPD